MVIVLVNPSGAVSFFNKNMLNTCPFVPDVKVFE